MSPESSAKRPISQKSGSELRTDPLTGQQVIIAPGRGLRPHSARGAAEASAPAREFDPACPFCPGNEHETPPAVLTLPEEANGGSWSIRVVPNLFPMVSASDGPQAGERPSLPASGSHEVVIETPRHDLELPDRDEEDIAAVLVVLQRRLAALLAERRTRYVSVFKNRGGQAGTSLEHPHSQIVALDFLPEPVSHRVRRARGYFRKRGVCLLCAMLRDERDAGARIVHEAGDVVAFAPYVSPSGGQVMVASSAHAASFTDAADGTLRDLARTLRALLRANRAAHGDPDYNLVLYTAPAGRLQDPALHWYWQLAPRLAHTGGFELGTGVLVNSLDPDDAARMLREAIGGDVPA
jgi:UDPglucose--hexose-1-phosphate uridylyltransferase